MDNEIKISEEFILPRDLSAMAKTFFVKTEKPLREESWFLKKGSTVTGVKVIAAGANIRDVNRLINEYSLKMARKLKLKIGTNVAARQL